MDVVEKLRREIPLPEFDYQALVGALKDYARPRGKISDLLAKGVLIRVKKGLYVFGEAYRINPYSREILANLVYGPSCVSLEYALHLHGLIPERVETLTSVTPKRPKDFSTPVGMFSYASVPEEGFAIGIDRRELKDGRAYLIACREKALADKLRNDRGLSMRTQKECLGYLLESLRMEQEDLRDMDADLLDRLAEGYRSRRVRLLASLVRKLKRQGGAS